MNMIIGSGLDRDVSGIVRFLYIVCFQSRDITEVSFEVINKLTNTLLARKIEGEEDTTLKQDEITLAAGKAKAEEIANKVVKTIESEVQLPSNLTSFSNATSLEHVVCFVFISFRYNKSTVCNFAVFDPLIIYHSFPLTCAQGMC